MEEPRRLGGRYELGQVLGRGGMAEVYLAHDTRLGRTVAVKTLRADLARDPSFQARFRREAQSAASLNHPAIVAVYDTGEDYIDGVSIPYIVMEYVDGSTLRELLHSGRKLLPERAMEMTIGILQGLEYAHRNGIVHRDIKPANVMLTRTGQVKVMDFGIARAMGDAGMTMTQTAAVIGTAQYLSPEQAKGEQVDARSDLYSTGCLLYELLTVRPPFVGDSPVAVAYQHVREEPQPPSVFDPEISPEMDAIVLRALVKDPDYRYQTADEMRADIEACLDGQPVAATAAMGTVGYGTYGDDQPTTALRPDSGAPATTTMPPVTPDDGGYGYDERPGRRRQKKSHTSTILLVVAGILVLAGAVLIGRMLTTGHGVGNDKVNVPNFVDHTKADAEKMAENVGLEVTFTEQPCDNEPKGRVCSQDPAKDTEIKKGETVSLVLSTGAPKVLVPDVTGLTFETAQSQLEAKGFKVEQKTEESDRPEGVVISQDPAGDQEVEKGSTITVTVAKPVERVPVPDVLNKTCEEATAQLQGSGLKASCVQEDTTDPNQIDKVFEISPAAGTPVEKGSTVTLKIGKQAPPPQQTPVPQVRGHKLGEAQQILSQAGFTNIKVNGSQDPNAFVIAQDPQPNQPVDNPAGTQITLTAIGGGPGGPNPAADRGGHNGGFFG
ncbi:MULTISPECIES: Stk1 family PASTA domain-containing Ser/Thr kinase [Streptomyces]|uniref:non-specific serine/threonine protein kinase n=1 Tax=Streptomyces thermoviolaceus subsp. thermoviolaceus TaxID=66860 RepID=A0ABX0YTH9_STRTL|nr:Stk1 family PASTA domain-containing Ser/Thr kinase [Streptomyces thermoviolaceus]MCM3266830.1 Stk1 family PASTA domain-containing Ser/Thr kinase [Streptomyces thermoviolaceus]NJP15881.1 Stk1 family PASTA domain-containing Ser/Thr kinase [Streptomyces thermoviolaceus subsp. thermoviolaceus]WTD48418.1 Stk1 family PASTA domain-containing Ser/Thr kinase [Streptomyces thermoviolaceus]GGV72757.1 putative serine/threonine-protein kinase [Streptomyces thermoviolaceus subsp. apingens]GHA88340.1 puta